MSWRDDHAIADLMTIVASQYRGQIADGNLDMICSALGFTSGVKKVEFLKVA